jgi:large subunit ribosomal protein L28
MFRSQELSSGHGTQRPADFQETVAGTGFFCYIRSTLNIDLTGDTMAKQCDICGKKPVTGNNISHAHNRTRRRWEPNLQSVRAKVGGQTKRLTVCAQCLKSNKVLKAA